MERQQSVGRLAEAAAEAGIHAPLLSAFEAQGIFGFSIFCAPHSARGTRARQRRAYLLGAERQLTPFRWSARGLVLEYSDALRGHRHSKGKIAAHPKRPTLQGRPEIFTTCPPPAVSGKDPGRCIRKRYFQQAKPCGEKIRHVLVFVFCSSSFFGIDMIRRGSRVAVVLSIPSRVVESRGLFPLL